MEKENKSPIYRFLKQLDWTLIISVGVLVVFGLMAVYSATSRFGNPQVFYVKQLTALGFGFLIAILLLGLNYKFFRNYALLLYILSVVLLVLVLVLGIKSRGSKSWFDFYLFTFQPAEITKIAFVLVLAAYLDKFWMQVQNLKVVLVSILIMFAHVVLILIQPDFSSSLVYFPVLLGMLYVSGAKLSHLGSITLYGFITVSVPLINTFLKLQPKLVESNAVIGFIYNALHGFTIEALLLAVILILAVFIAYWLLGKLLIYTPVTVPLVISCIIIAGFISSRAFQMSIKEYQQKRLITFIDSKIDPFGSGYNIEQSKIAVGSGRFFGKGYLSGTQARLGFVPEQHTDFIFSVISEEFGFAFAAFLLGIYGLLIFRAYAIARDSRDRYGSLVASGLGCMYVFYLIINVGMVMGMMPVTGLPLPFISYGGSSMVSAVAGIGILMSIYVRRYTH